MPHAAPARPARRPLPPAERPTPEPTRRLGRGARLLWTVEALGWALPLLLITSVVARPLQEAGGAMETAAVALYGVVLAAAAVGVLVVPQLRWRHWRYEVREQEIDLRRGAFTIRRTLVPMSRVQHVDTRRTMVSRMLNLAAVVFHTAAGANEIPALTELEAAEIRDQIADLAATSDDPV